MKKYKEILFSPILMSLVFLCCLSLIHFYDYPGLLPDGLLADINNIVLSVQNEPSKAIVVNLRNMIMDTYENDSFRKRYPVLAAGNSRTTPTPIGEFEVLTKYDNVMSSLSGVWMPWSMRFYKQYYIHEVPYYPSGAKVTSQYSLGCLRLKEGDAQEVYEWADLGTKVRVMNTKLAREEDNDTIYYLTEEGLKRAIINQEVFLSYNNKWSDVVVVLPGQLDSYLDVELIRADSDHKVYRLENGKKRWIYSIEAFEGLGYKWKDIVPVNQIELTAWPTAAPIY